MTKDFYNRCITSCCLLLLIGAVMISSCPLLFCSFLLVVFLYCLLYEVPLISKNYYEQYIINMVIAGAFSIIAYWYAQERLLVYICFLSASLFDTAAYIGGNLFSKHIIWPSISPKKSWEGLLSGLTALIALNACARLSYNLLFIIGLATSATIGDFIESWLKRRVAIKDVGKILPGHGGVLDRIDSLIAIIFYNVVVCVISRYMPI